MVNIDIFLRYRVAYRYLEIEEYLEIFRGNPRIEIGEDHHKDTPQPEGHSVDLMGHSWIPNMTWSPQFAFGLV